MIDKCSKIVAPLLIYTLCNSFNSITILFSFLFAWRHDLKLSRDVTVYDRKGTPITSQNSLSHIFSIIIRVLEDKKKFYYEQEIKIKGWTRGFPLKVIGILTSWRISSVFVFILNFPSNSQSLLVYVRRYILTLCQTLHNRKTRKCKNFWRYPSKCTRIGQLEKSENNTRNYNQIWRKTMGRVSPKRSVLCWPLKGEDLLLVASPRPPAVWLLSSRIGRSSI